MAPATAGAGFCRVSSFDGCAVSGSSPGETKAGANAPARFLSRPSGWSQDGDDRAVVSVRAFHLSAERRTYSARPAPSRHHVAAPKCA